MTTQDSTHGAGTDQYGGPAPEDVGGPDEYGRQGSYADQHSADLPEADLPEADVPEADVPVTDAVERPRDGARRSDGDPSAGSAANGSGRGAGDGDTTLIPVDRAGEFKGRWTEMKADFVDEPRDTVRKIDGLVGEVLDELNEVFKRQRNELERDLKNDDASTEDLRVAFRRYRQFFDRLLSV